MVRVLSVFFPPVLVVTTVVVHPGRTLTGYGNYQVLDMLLLITYYLFIQLTNTYLVHQYITLYNK